MQLLSALGVILALVRFLTLQNKHCNFQYLLEEAMLEDIASEPESHTSNSGVKQVSTQSLIVLHKKVCLISNNEHYLILMTPFQLKLTHLQSSGKIKYDAGKRLCGVIHCRRSLKELCNFKIIAFEYFHFRTTNWQKILFFRPYVDFMDNNVLQWNFLYGRQCKLKKMTQLKSDSVHCVLLVLQYLRAEKYFCLLRHDTVLTIKNLHKHLSVLK